MAGALHSSNHPPLPPTAEDDRILRLRLLRSYRVGPSTYHRLIEEHGSARAALDALPEIALEKGITKYEPCPEGVVRAEMKRAKNFGAVPLFSHEEGFPTRLAEVSDAPPMIWAAGRLKHLHAPTIAIVGARNASSLGTRMARRLARGLGEAGFTIVSGLARGIDAAAHAASLETGTIAVQAGGLDVVYPSENAQLAKDILQKGVRISEQPFELSPQARHFPRRNRIISGLADAVLVVEAAAKSGTLITAQQALDQGRDVMAVPGHPVDARTDGCNMLIRDGATLIRSVDDVLEALQAAKIMFAPTAPKPTHNVVGFAEPPQAPLRKIAKLHQKILDRLGPSPTSEDQLARDLKCKTQTLGPTLTELEVNGKIHRMPGGLLSKISP